MKTVLVCLATVAAASASGWQHGWDTVGDMWWGDFGYSLLTQQQARFVAQKYKIVSLEKCTGRAQGMKTEAAISLDKQLNDESCMNMVGFPMAKGDLSWLPPTCGALSLRLATLDSAVVYDTHKKNAKAGCQKNQAYKFIQRDFYINDDGTNFTYVAANGQLRTGALQMASMNFPAFPEVAISKPQVFGLPAKDFAEQLRTIGFFYDDGQEEAAEEPIPPGKAGRARRASKRAKAIVESDEESEDSGDDFVMAEAAGNGAGGTSDED